MKTTANESKLGVGLLVRFAPGHCPTGGFSAWKNTVQDASYPAVPVAFALESMEQVEPNTRG